MIDIYDFTGTYDPQTDLDEPEKTHEILFAIINDFNEKKSPELLVPKGGDIIGYSGLSGENKIIIEWSMEGEIWTYRFSMTVLYNLALNLQKLKNIDPHPCSIIISEEGQKKVNVTSFLDKGRRVVIDSRQAGSTLQLEGEFYPQRKRSQTAMERSLTSLHLKIPSTGEVPDDWNADSGTSGVPIDVHIDYDSLPASFRVHFPELLMLLEDVSRFFERQGQWADLWGIIEKHNKVVGVFHIGDRFSEGNRPTAYGIGQVSDVARLA